MSQREGHARGGAIAPTRPADSPTPASGCGRNPLTPGPFDDAFPTPPPSQTQPLDVGSRSDFANSTAPSHGEEIQAVLQAAFANRLPSLSLGEPVPVMDQLLDDAQRDAVVRALQSPDLLLIQGPPGTGKTRVVIEIVRQIAGRGERVLILSPMPAALDQALPALTDLAVVRRIGPGESAGKLPVAIAALTPDGRRALARDHLIRQSDAAVAAAAARLQRIESVRPLCDELAELRDRRSGQSAEREGLVARRGTVANDLRREADSGGEPAPYFVQRLRSADSAHARRSSQFDVLASELLTERRTAEETIRRADAECQNLRPKADALQHGRWYTLTFWKAKSDAQLAERLTQSEGRLAAARAAIDELIVREQKLAGDRRLADEEHAAERERLLNGETARRLAELDARIADVDRSMAADAIREAELLSALRKAGVETSDDPTSIGREVQSARDELESSRRRAAETQAHLDRLVDEICASVSVIAGQVASVAADPDVLAVGQFDLLIIDDAHRVAEADFLAAARLARRSILAGEPCEIPLTRIRTPRPDVFARLAASLRHDVWVRDGDRLVCRLYPLLGADRRRLECEPVADAPDIELRLFNSPGGEPTLAEVAFPNAAPVPAAREYLFRELGEITCAPQARTATWQTTPEELVLRFGPAEPAATFAVIGDGIREELADLETRAIHFDSTWTFERAREWAAEHIGRRDSGRVVTLCKSHRVCPGLARWLNRAFGNGFAVPAAVDEIAHVEFLAVPDTDSRRRREPQQRSGRVGGAGYEIDLSDPRQRAALPADCGDLPATGFVNVPEAQAIVRYLEPVVVPGLAVASPFPSQVMLLRRLLARSSRLARLPVLDAVEAMRHECEILVVSLTRSHVARAVPFGESPTVLASLLGRVRKKVLFVGDPGTLARRLQWEGPVDHLDAWEAARERKWVAALADCPRVSPPRHR